MSDKSRGGPPAKSSFEEILEKSASVDDIFRDAPTPKGSNPFSETNEQTEPEFGVQLTPMSVETAESVDVTDTEAMQDSSISILDNDSLFCINRKFAAVEALFKLVNREYLTFGQLMSEVLRIAADHVKSEAGSLLEVDHQNNCLFFRAAAGRASQDLLNFTVPMGQGIVGFVCDNQQIMSLSSVDESSVYLRTISDAVGFETKNLIAVPIVIRGQIFGCIELLNRLGEAQYTDADKEVLGVISEYAAKVIENRLVMSSISTELHELRSLIARKAA